MSQISMSYVTVINYICHKKPAYELQTYSYAGKVFFSESPNQKAFTII